MCVDTYIYIYIYTHTHTYTHGTAVDGTPATLPESGSRRAAGAAS